MHVVENVTSLRNQEVARNSCCRQTQDEVLMRTGEGRPPNSGRRAKIHRRFMPEHCLLSRPRMSSTVRKWPLLFGAYQSSE